MGDPMTSSIQYVHGSVEDLTNVAFDVVCALEVSCPELLILLTYLNINVDFCVKI